MELGVNSVCPECCPHGPTVRHPSPASLFLAKDLDVSPGSIPRPTAFCSSSLISACLTCVRTACTKCKLNIAHKC